MMTKEEALALFNGNKSALARELGITPQAIHKWPDGPIPELQWMKLHYEILPRMKREQAQKEGN